MFQKLFTKIGIIILLTIGNSFFIDATAQTILFNKYYTQEDGLCSSVINSIEKDKKGFLWLATESGLMRFDGYKFKTYRHNPSVNASLTSSDIRAIGFEDNGDILLRTENSISKYNKINNTFQSLYSITDNYGAIKLEKGITKGDWWLFKKDSLIKINVTTETIESFKFLEGHDLVGITSILFVHNKIIYTSKNKVCCFNTVKKIFEKINFQSAISSPTTFEFVFGFKYKQSPYIFKNGVLYKWNDTNNTTEYIVDTKIKLASKQKILSHFETSKYILLALSDFKIIKINIENGNTNCIRLDSVSKGARPPLYNFFKSNNDNEVWLNGLTKVIYKLNVETNEVSKNKIELPLQYNTDDLYRVQYILPSDKVIWVAVSGFGLIKCELTNYSFSSFKPYVNAETGRDIWSNNVRTIADWDAENYIIGTLHGTFLFNKKTKKFNNFSTPLAKENIQNLANAKILNYNNYTLLGGWYSQKITVINRLTNEVCTIDITPDNKEDYFSIRSLLIDSKKQLWVGTTESKLYKLPFDSFIAHQQFKIQQLITNKNKLRSVNTIFSIEETKNNEILLGTQNGFYILNHLNDSIKAIKNSPSDVHSLSRNNVRSIYAASDAIWLGTNGGGLNRYDIKTATVKHFAMHDGLPEDYIYALLPDDKKNIWLATNKGIGCFNTQTNTCQNYSIIDGIQNFEFNTNAALISKDGNYIFGGINGISIFNPFKIYKNTDAPAVAFTKIKINDIEMPESRTSFNCKHFENSITFEFVALNYYQNQENKYSYKLEGFDEDWIYAGHQHQVNYTNLPPGDYTFKVKAANSSGMWNAVGQSITISIPSIWYTTWWLKVLLAILFVLIIYFIYRFRLNEEIKLQQLRNNIAQDLHDEIGSNLSSISLFTQVAQQTLNNSSNNEQRIALNKIEQYAQISQDAMSDIVWMINPRNDTFNNIFIRIQTLASEILEANNINFKMEIDKQLESKELNLHQRKNFYLICKESINNISKHAHCSHVQIKIDYHLGNINALIMDNGNGFKQTNNEFGNGLINMQKRAKDIGGILIINSNVNKGTTLSLTFPIEKIYNSKKVNI
ncbi:MAG: hypothetical protein RIQ33_85 [Bacteroidota bacterium]|jgi:ligand-binding sensor domain-containing protein